MTDRLVPETAEQVRDAVRWAAAEEVSLELVSGGGLRGFGRPMQTERTLDLSRLSGILLYEPEELVMSAAPGTRLAEIRAALAERGQHLAFEPPDWGPLFGGAADRGSIAGVFSCNLAGPRRLTAGAARDHLLGVGAVAGRGEIFKTGGRVVKNVTGYDLCKLMTGAFGTLGALTALTFKVLPAPETTATLLLVGLDDAAGTAALAEAMQGSFDVSGTAHLPRGAVGRCPVPDVAALDAPVTALRLEGFGPSVTARLQALRAALADRAPMRVLERDESLLFWQAVGAVAPLLPVDHGTCLWRLSVPPTAGAPLAATVLSEQAGEALFDWSGGLVWLALTGAGEDGGAARVRGALAAAGCGGHATLVRGPDAVRATVPVFQPQPPALAALAGRVKDSFDPRRVLNPGRMAAAV